MHPLGDGFTWLSKDIEKDKMLAREGWQICRQKMLSGDYDLIVLDEMTYVLKYGWLSWEEVRETLDKRPAGMHVVVTGRYTPPELVAYADLVSEVVEVKQLGSSSYSMMQEENERPESLLSAVFMLLEI